MEIAFDLAGEDNAQYESSAWIGGNRADGLRAVGRHRLVPVHPSGATVPQSPGAGAIIKAIGCLQERLHAHTFRISRGDFRLWQRP